MNIRLLPHAKQRLRQTLIVALMAAPPAWAQIEPLPPSRDALLSSAQTQRDSKQWKQALTAYRQGQALYPRDKAFVFGEIYALADGGESQLAVTLAQQLLNAQADDPDALLVMSYARLRNQGAFAALQYADQAYQAAPDKRYVVTEYVDALQRTSQPSRALEIAEQHSQWFDITKRRELESAAAAEIVRQADLPTRSEAERFVLADKALARYDALLAAWSQAGDAAPDLIHKARIDRMAALHARRRMGDVVKEYEALRAQGIQIPDYAIDDVANAYLTTGAPEQAALLYQQLIDHGYQQGNESERQRQYSGLVNAYSDQGATELSQQLAAPMQSQFAAWHYAPGDPERRANDAYLAARQTAAMTDLYAGNTDKAQQALEKLISEAPGNNGIRLDLARLYQLRGWPRQSETELKRMEASEPRSIALEVSQAQTALRLQEWRQAQELAEDAQARAPENADVQRLARQWAVHNMYELEVGAYKGLSNGSPVAGNQDYGLEATLYSPPIHDNWRLFAGAGHRSASYNESKARLNFSRMGLEWRSRGWTTQAEVNDSHFGAGSRSGAAINTAYSLDDQWQITAGAQWRSRDTPLRALQNNITSNQFNIGLRWQGNEQRSWSLNLAPSRFSDGNQRTDVLLTGKERWITKPRWSLDLGLETYATHNSRINGPYYSPRNEYGITPSLTWSHAIQQRYQKAWTQQVSIGIGGLHQQGYRTSTVGIVSYGQRYRANDVFEAGATLSALTRPYDGVREREWRLIFDMNFRF